MGRSVSLCYSALRHSPKHTVAAAWTRRPAPWRIRCKTVSWQRDQRGAARSYGAAGGPAHTTASTTSSPQQLHASTTSSAVTTSSEKVGVGNPFPMTNITNITSIDITTNHRSSKPIENDGYYQPLDKGGGVVVPRPPEARDEGVAVPRPPDARDEPRDEDGEQQHPRPPSPLEDATTDTPASRSPRDRVIYRPRVTPAMAATFGRIYEEGVWGQHGRGSGYAVTK